MAESKVFGLPVVAKMLLLLLLTFVFIVMMSLSHHVPCRPCSDEQIQYIVYCLLKLLYIFSFNETITEVTMFTKTSEVNHFTFISLLLRNPQKLN